MNLTSRLQTCLFVGNGGQCSSAQGLASFRDDALDLVKVFKKKLSLRVECNEDGKPLASETLRVEMGKLKMCFAGRLAVLPKGQPPSIFKSKVVRVASTFFGKLGCDLFVVPLTNQTAPEFAVKSPLFSAAWLVKGKTKGANMKIDYIDVKMSLPNVDCDASIDLRLPVLILASPEAMEFSKVKVQETFWSGCDLSRSLTDIEEAELAGKQDSKQRAAELKQKRDAALSEDFADRPDEQVCIPEHLLKHVLK